MKFQDAAGAYEAKEIIIVSPNEQALNLVVDSGKYNDDIKKLKNSRKIRGQQYGSQKADHGRPNSVLRKFNSAVAENNTGITLKRKRI